MIDPAATIDELLSVEARLADDIAVLLARDELGDAEMAALRRLETERRTVVAAQLAPRLRAGQRVSAAVDHLGGLGPLSEIIGQAPRAVAQAIPLDRVVLSRVDGDQLAIEGVHAAVAPPADPERLVGQRVRLDYPLAEAELVRRRHGRLVVDCSQPLRHAFCDELGWGAYVVAPVVVEGRVLGFLQGDRLAALLSPLDLHALEAFAGGLARVVERAVLSRRLREQQREIRQIATWADARTSELSDRAINLAVGDAPAEQAATTGPAVLAEDGITKLLTPRELDVLALMADGKTNPEIARTLFVSAGTIKFHVKNVLRKLQAANRAEATSRYLKRTLPGNGRANPIHR